MQHWAKNSNSLIAIAMIAVLITLFEAQTKNIVINIGKVMNIGKDLCMGKVV